MQRRTLAKLAVGPALALGLALAPAPASAQQKGLVNVNISDVTVQVPIGVAANVCDVTVAVLAGLVIDGASTECGADGTATAVAPPSNGGGGNSQRGLINLNLENVDVQVPIGIAANICGVSAGVLVLALIDGSDTTCQADAISISR